MLQYIRKLEGLMIPDYFLQNCLSIYWISHQASPIKKSVQYFQFFNSFSLVQKTQQKFMLISLQRKFNKYKHKLLDWLIQECALLLFWKICVQTILWSFMKKLYDGSHLFKSAHHRPRFVGDLLHSYRTPIL